MTAIAPLIEERQARREGGGAGSPPLGAFATLARMSGAAAIALDLIRHVKELPWRPGERARGRALAVHRASRELCAAHGLRVAARGQLPEPPFVLVANHVSWLDPIVLCAHTPAAAIGKHEIGDWPVVGTCARETGMLLVDRGSSLSGARAIVGALRAIKQGVSVLNFPEGTTTGGRTPLPFRRGIFGAARIAGVPIVPAAVTYDDPGLCWVGDDLFVTHYLRFASRRSAEASIAIGDPIPADRARSANELAALAWNSILNLLTQPG